MYMKAKILCMALFCLFYSSSVKSQEVFQQVVDRAKLVLEDPQANQFMINVAQFKYTAMQYLCNTSIKRNNGEGVPADYLDLQAYSMNHFITSYFSELAKLQNNSNSTQKDVMKKYWRASAENPLFNDPDKETTNAFMNDPNCITPFSLDTDWEKADNAISKE